ncbi:DUF1697 domain-containing protein [Pseudoruegeria sp. HB172150]|uniref:DUF1697 domain-containing protein n=1 Tax=Pseudoruegeria sp. HB172150 TaxID=2721164 RepID=UPI001552C4BD|nr:DUF1697 domain-containing protein [Pseudoruegeria sp. HB172150]
MSVTVALLRGINVGGKNSLPMAEWRAMLEGLGAEEVKTYIQSGNAVFRGEVGAGAISDAIETEKGFRPHVLVLPLSSYEEVLDACPYAEQGETDGKAVHVFFADGKPKQPDAAILALATETEAVAVAGNTAFLLAPDGIGRSKLAAKLEKALSVPVTARNWKSAVAIRALGRGIA